MFRYIKTTFSKPFKTTLTKIKIVGKYKLNAPSLEQVNWSIRKRKQLHGRELQCTKYNTKY